MDERGFRVPELGSHIAGDPEVGILIDAAGNEDGDVVARLDARKEGGNRLDARVENLANVVRVVKPEYRLGRRERNPLRGFDRDGVEVMDELRVKEDPCPLRVETHRDDIQRIVVSDPRRLVELLEVFEEVLLVVRDLKV